MTAPPEPVAQSIEPNESAASTRSLWPALSRLLDEALDLPAAERAAWLQALPESQAALRPRLVSLLAAAEAADTAAVFGHSGLAAETDSQLAAGMQIGPWRLLAPLGEGGMGTVWRAERVDGLVRRTVALKVPHIGWARGLAERMARERQILSSLDHPNIARLIDTGIDDQGRPWLAIEEVVGEPLHRWRAGGVAGETDKGAVPPLRQRLTLLLQVCDAVAYAHARLVIHRDLKPANILVTSESQAKLLDFGIAKLLDTDAAMPSDATALTRVAGMPYTPEYASPEQIEGLPLGTASDVYSLGVVAFELLTGQRPYRLRRGNRAELTEAIREGDLPLASATSTEPAVRRALRGDLDAILAKALAVEVADRYPNVDALAQDLRRHLAGDTIQARRPPWRERLQRWLRRHRLVASAVTAVVLALTGGAAVALWQAQEAATQRDVAAAQAERSAREAARADGQARIAAEQAERADAEAERARAESDLAQRAREQATAAALAEQAAAVLARGEAARATATQAYLLDLFAINTQLQPDPQKARQTTVRELLDIGAERLQGQFADQPQTRLALGSMLTRLYQELGLHERALAVARPTLAAAEQVAPGSAKHLLSWASLLEAVRNVGNSAQIAEESARAETWLAGRTPRPTPEWSQFLLRLSAVHEFTGDGRGQRYAEQALVLARGSGDAVSIQYASQIHGRRLLDMGQTAQAEPLLEEALRASRRAGQLPSERSTLYSSLAESQAVQLKYDEAISSFRDAIEENLRQQGADHIDVSQLRLRLANTLFGAGRLREALALQRETDAVLAAQAPVHDLPRSLLLSDMGLVLALAGEFDAAERTLDLAQSLRDKLRPRSDAAAGLRERRAQFEIQRGRPDAASRWLAEADTLREGLGQGVSHPRRWSWWLAQAALARAQGDSAGAARWLAQFPPDDAAQLSTRQGQVVAVARMRTAIDQGQLDVAAASLTAAERALRQRDPQQRVLSMWLPLRVACATWAEAAGARRSAMQWIQALEPALSREHAAQSALARDVQALRVRAERPDAAAPPPLPAGCAP